MGHQVEVVLSQMTQPQREAAVWRLDDPSGDRLAAGALPEGIYDIRVTNPNGNAATSVGALAVSDKPSVTDVAPDIVCLAGFMRILTPGFTEGWAGRMLNIHPSLLPKYKGLHTHQRALEASDTTHGCSVHEVTGELDGGPILGQATVEIAPDDTPDSLAAKVLRWEHRLYPLVLKRFALGDRQPVFLP